VRVLTPGVAGAGARRVPPGGWLRRGRLPASRVGALFTWICNETRRPGRPGPSRSASPS